MLDKPYAEQRSFGSSFRLALGLFSCALALLFFLQSALFTVQSVDVVGHVLLSRDELLRIAGLEYGQTLFDVDVRQAKARLESHAQIERAEVRRVYPNRVRLAIVERIPVALIPHAEGFAALDGTGRVLFVTDRLRLPYPLLTGSSQAPEGSKPGERAGSVDERALKVAAALPQDLLAVVGEIVADKDGIRLHTREGIVVQLGDLSQLDEKLVTLSALLRSIALSGQRVQQIDLRLPKTPVLR